MVKKSSRRGPPGKGVSLEFVYKVEEKAPVLPVEILNTKAFLLLRQQNFIPDN
jgi:hypothetical protein